MEPLDPKRYTVNYTWTQSYPSMNPYYSRNEALERELDLLDTIDLIVDTMTEYPQAQQLLEKLL